MKYILLTVVLLGGCADFVPPNEAVAKSIVVCLDKGWIPVYKSTNSRINFTCTPYKR